jgi:PadR family transcriptional regulator AphA
MPGERGEHNLTTTEHALLGMLARYGEHSGYELLKLAEAGIGYFWSPAKSHVYDVLPRLERQGFVRVRGVRQLARPDKQLCRITPKGRAALRAWLNEVDPQPFHARGVFLLKLFFGDHGDPVRLVQRAESFRDQAAVRLQELRKIAEHEAPKDPADLSWLTLRQGLIVGAAHVRWAEEILPQLRQRAARAQRRRDAASRG